MFIRRGILLVTAVFVMNFIFGLLSGVYCSQARAEAVKIVRLTWRIQPGAVSYRMNIVRKTADGNKKLLKVIDSIPSPGYELEVYSLYDRENTYWQVCPLDFDGKQMAPYSGFKPVLSGTVNPASPLPLDEEAKMAYSLCYPTFFWIPKSGAHSYELHVRQEDPANPGMYNTIHEYTTDQNVFYGPDAYLKPGKYCWQVRGLSSSGAPVGEWSDPVYFDVGRKARVAALGDSITHGGGATCVPPSMMIYDWESYSAVPIKNLGLSGDTTEALNNRFEKDVLAFSPEILVIMGGVNDFREGTSADDIIYQLSQIGEKCKVNGIIPVYMTATPINPDLMEKLPTIENAAPNWKTEQEKLNQWILQQPYHIDVTPGLTDKKGQLRWNMTADGLHPDKAGKMFIGGTVGRYLLAAFPHRRLTEK